MQKREEQRGKAGAHLHAGADRTPDLQIIIFGIKGGNSHRNSNSNSNK